MKMPLTILLAFIGFVAFGQENKLASQADTSFQIQPETLDTLYAEALNARIDLLLQSGWLYVELNEFGSRLKRMQVNDRYKFRSMEALIDLSIKMKRPITVLRVTHRVISQDTVDINIGYLNVTGKRNLHFHKGIRFKKAEIAVSCGGTNGYQPDVRFVFDRSTHAWKIEP